MQGRTLSLVIPCFNESEALPWLFRELEDLNNSPLLAKNFGQLEVIIVDDASDEPMQWPLSLPSYVRRVRHEERGGYGAALKTGLLLSRGDWIGFFDLDGSYRPNDLFRLIDRQKDSQALIVYGNRLGQGSKMPMIRRLGNTLYSTLTRKLIGTDIQDVCTGWRLLHSQIKEECLSVSENGLNFSLSLTVHLSMRGIPQAEVSISYDERKGASKLKVAQDGLLFLWTVIKGKYAQLTNRSLWPSERVQVRYKKY